jgi:hypothetical protein
MKGDKLGRGHVTLMRGMRNAYKSLVVDLGLDGRIILK